MDPNKYDVIFMDVQMPVMDGLEATQEILEYEQEEGILHTPIIAVTANVLKGDRERFLGAGMDEYIAKPIEKNTLLKILERVAHGDFSKKHYMDQNAAENTAQNNQAQTPQTKTEEIEIIKPQNEPTTPQTENEEIPTNENDSIILATQSPFLSSYITNILEDVETVSSMEELTKSLTKHRNAIIMIDEDFNGSLDNLRTLVKSLKKLNPKKIIIIGDKEIENADVLISDLQPETIQKTVKG
jgi:CheY-like chemotaxis protein